MKKILLNISIVLLILGFIFGLFWIAILNEVYYYNTTEYSIYKIRVELINGSIDTISTEQPSNIHFQINCHTRKGNFNGCDLEAIPKKGELFLGGHWYDVRDGVINFKILSKKEITKEKLTNY